MEPNGRYRLRIYDANGDYETPLALNPGLSEAITEAKLIYGMYGNRVQVVTLHDPIDDDIEVPDTVHFDTGPDVFADLPIPTINLCPGDVAARDNL